jgi:uncharacterized protein (TIGR00725 family)
MARVPYVAVIGASNATDWEISTAEELGRALADADCVLVCGGLGGVMAAAARGAASAGGLTVGVLPGTDAASANPWIALPLPSGLGEARNALVVRFAEAVIAVGGEWGTLSEIALAMRTSVPVVLVEPTLAAGLGLEVADGPDEAVRLAIAHATRARNRRRP